MQFTSEVLFFCIYLFQIIAHISDYVHFLLDQEIFTFERLYALIYILPIKPLHLILLCPVITIIC